MNQTEQMNNAGKNPCLPPVKIFKPERVPVRFAGDFPVEFIIRRLEDVPLRMETGQARLFQTALQQP